MTAARTFGIERPVAETVSGALETAGWKCAGEHPLLGMDTVLAGLEAPCLVVARVADRADLGELRRCVHLERRHLYTAVARPGLDGGAIAELSLEVEGRLVLLPTGEAEFLRLFRACRGLARSRVARSALGRGLRTQRLSVRLATSDVHPFELAGYLVERLDEGGFCRDEESRRRMELAVEEALVNAVEHGNLELSSELRNGPGDVVDEYEALRRERLAQPRFAMRAVEVDLEIVGARATLSITDEGSGIDVGGGRPMEPGQPAGRGMALIRRAFDTVEHERSTVRLGCGKERCDAAGRSADH